jgi:hypothetical protein
LQAGGQRTGVRDHIAFEVVSNLLSHQEFASSMPARVMIGPDRPMVGVAAQTLRVAAIEVKFSQQVRPADVA